MDIEFVDELPGSSEQRASWVLVAAKLREAPGRWAIVKHVETKSKADSIYIALSRHNCEVRQRKQEDGTYLVYARSV